jgi:hypothetical protein
MIIIFTYFFVNIFYKNFKKMAYNRLYALGSRLRGNVRVLRASGVPFGQVIPFRPVGNSAPAVFFFLCICYGGPSWKKK